MKANRIHQQSHEQLRDVPAFHEKSGSYLYSGSVEDLSTLTGTQRADSVSLRSARIDVNRRAADGDQGG